MITTTIQGHKVEMYDSIDALPYNRYIEFTIYSLIAAGAGTSLTDFDSKIAKVHAKQQLALSLLSETEIKDKTKALSQLREAASELNNLRQALRFTVAKVSPEMLSFAVMVKSIDSKPRNDISEGGLKQTLAMLSAAPQSLLSELLASIKKKVHSEIEAENTGYNTESLTYYSLLNTYIKTTLSAIKNGEAIPENNTSELEAFGEPVELFGAQGVEQRIRSQYSDLRIALSSRFNLQIDNLSTRDAIKAINRLNKIVKEERTKK